MNPKKSFDMYQVWLVPRHIINVPTLIMTCTTVDCPKSIRNYEKSNVWNIRCLVDVSTCQMTCRGPLSFVMRTLHLQLYELKIPYLSNLSIKTTD